MIDIDVAVVRPPAATFADGLTTADLGRPDVGLALEQHAAYCGVLEDLGVEVVRLPADDAFPDSTFVEDTAVVTSGGAIVTRPGAPSRRGETAAVADALRRHGVPVTSLGGTGTVDGGDVCQVGDRFLIGRSDRTDAAGARALADALAVAGHPSVDVEVPTGALLHLKSGLSWIGDETVVAVRALAGHPALRGLRVVPVDDDDAYAANCIALNGSVVLPSGFPVLRGRIEAVGLDVREVDVSEFRRMDGGVSCLSIRIPGAVVSRSGAGAPTGAPAPHRPAGPYST